MRNERHAETGVLSKTRVIQQRRVYLAVGTAGLLFAGSSYAWSILKEPLGEEFGWTASQLAFNYTLALVMTCLGNLLAAVLSARISRRILVAASAILLCSGFILSSGLRGDTIIPLYLSYGCMGGLGTGMYVVVINSLLGDWFPDKKGVCSSVLQSGFGSSALLIGQAAGRLMKIPGIGWRRTYLWIGVLAGTTLGLAALLIKSPALDTCFPKPKHKAERSMRRTGGYELTTRQMLRRKGYRNYYLYCFLLYGVGSATIGLATDFFYGVGVKPETAVFLVGIMSISNLFGRFSVGICFDRFGRSKALLYILSLSCLGVLLLPVSFAVHSITGVATGICLIAASYGCVSSSTSPVIREAYGDTHFTSNYGVTLTSAMPASLLATVTAVILTRGGSFHMIFIVFGFFAISAFALFFGTREL